MSSIVLFLLLPTHVYPLLQVWNTGIPQWDFRRGHELGPASLTRLRHLLAGGTHLNPVRRMRAITAYSHGWFTHPLHQ